MQNSPSNGELSSVAVFNAKTTDVAQVGRVYTISSLRGQGLAKTLMHQLIPLPTACGKLEKIVAETRTLFENRQVNRQLLQALYRDYNQKVKNLNLFVKKAEELFPYLNCGLVTVYLKKLLKSGKIINGKYEDKNHTFLLITNPDNMEFIIDITADQYGGPSMYVGPLQAPWTLDFR